MQQTLDDEGVEDLKIKRYVGYLQDEQTMSYLTGLVIDAILCVSGQPNSNPTLILTCTLTVWYVTVHCVVHGMILRCSPKPSLYRS